MSRQHFHTFDALRFFSFLLVFLLHIPKTGIVGIDFFLKSGGIGVAFFFVLSGFLISYILLYEKSKTEKISLKNFFARRILRIWPLFYLMIAFAYLSPLILNLLNIPFTDEGYKPNIIASLLFGENYMMINTGTFPNGAPLRVMWSLCIEEHFYIIWGIAMYFISYKHVPYLIGLCIVIANCARPIFSMHGIEHVDILTNIDYFAYGAIPAYLLMHKHKAIAFVNSIPLVLKYALLVFTAATVFIIPNLNSDIIDLLTPSILGILFATTILFTLGNRPIHIKDNYWFSRLGIYTYGLYLYHTIVILFLMQIFKMMGISNWLALSASAFVITVIISAMSYHLFEKQFLKLKKYFYK